jgi:hypothetical protein
MSATSFEAQLYEVNSWVIAKLSADASATLPSRGQVMVKGTINDFAFQTALEPDGNSGHWLHVDKGMQESANIAVGDTVTVTIESTKDWLEPTIPADWTAILENNADIQALWTAVTPMARWEWLRWISATNNTETRAKRIEVSCSKLRNGERRPCCFNRSMCCVPEVSKSGVLIEPTAKPVAV